MLCHLGNVCDEDYLLPVILSICSVKVLLRCSAKRVSSP